MQVAEYACLEVTSALSSVYGQHSALDLVVTVALWI